ncbi:uncharacterized protein LOC123873447 [Maniola jurtina]|uniref:uncharacterized protein LOC123873447 n=1 Tax=Maniola jurtina TaxID=191418 RepID=UPI001E68D1BA|nr:uncharacterized protein LOC123873447 [Maniola jurtina]
MVMADPEAVVNGSKDDMGVENYSLRIFHSTLNLLAHILIGIVVGICVLFAFRNGLPLNMTNMHIVLCVIGYQLLMSEAILALCPHNSWSSGLKLVDKKRTHTILQILGSTLAIVGSILKMLDKSTNFNTLHGQFGLVAMVFTTVSLVNGLTSLYAYELRNYIPGNFSKIPHIIFGVVAYVTSLICLCYGLDKGFFKNWTAAPNSSGEPQHHGFAYAIMGMAAAFTFIIIVNPMITAFNKTRRVFNLSQGRKVKMVMADPEAVVNGSKDDMGVENYSLRIFHSTLNLLAHILIGIVVGICVLFAFRNGLPLNMTNMHIVLCVIGYQLLMSEAILALCPHNSWSSGLKLVDKKRTHTILQILGSTLAIVGSILKMLDKSTNFNTLHGQFGLVAMVFTTVSLVNGLTSLYAYELRNYIPGNFSKIPHIIFGVVAYVTSLICLCYGLDKGFFKNWTAAPNSSGEPQHHGFAYAIMGMAAAFTFIIIVNPMITAFNKTRRVFK